MTAVLMTLPVIKFTDSAGAPLAGGKVYFYVAGTSTPKDTYTTAAGNVANTNPVILDSSGAAVIFLSGSYKVNVTSSADVQQGNWPVDNITSFATGAVSTTVTDNTFTIQNSSDLTKQGVFSLSGLTTATTSTLTWPASSGTIARLSDVTSGMTQIATATPSAVATSDFTSIPTTYRQLILVFTGISSDTASRSLLFQPDFGGGFGTDTVTYQVYDSVGGTNTVAAGQTSLFVWSSGFAAASTNSGIITMTSYAANAPFVYKGYAINDAAGETVYFDGVSSSSTVIRNKSLTGLRAKWSGAGNFDAGSLTLYGVN